MAKVDLGTKRIDPETGRKFYDLNKDPIVSPYTGIAYPRSAFETPAKAPRPSTAKAAVVADEEDEVEVEKDAETVSLEEADEEAGASGAVKADGVDDDIDAADDDEEDDTFLADEEDDEEEAVEDIVGDVDDEEP